MHRRHRASIAGLSATLVFSLWACRAPARHVDATRIRPDATVALHGHDLVIHLLAASTQTKGPLILYVTGDGGWSSDQELFEEMIPWGYSLAGFDAADYVGHLGDSAETIAAPDLASDYLTIVDTAARGLGLPGDVRVVLVGLSRGSGLDVAAATDARLRARLQGVLAVALTGEEEYVVDPEAGDSNGRGPMLLTYPVLPRLGDTKVAVIQSTRDGYLPADEARRRFGVDTPTRRFVAIDAADHTFGGKLPELYANMKSCFDWIVAGR